MLVYQRAWCNPNDLSPWHWRQKLGQHRAKILADFVVLVAETTKPVGLPLGILPGKIGNSLEIDGEK